MTPSGSCVRDPEFVKDTVETIPVLPSGGNLPRRFLPIVIAGLLLGGCRGAPPAPAPEAASRGVIRTGVVEHIVVRGETLHSIARTYTIAVDSLLGANPAVDPARLRVGQRLSIPQRKPEVRRVETMEGPR